MNIEKSHIFWSLYCLAETLRENKVEYNDSIEELFDLIPFGIVKRSVRIGNAAPVCEWAMTHLGYIATKEGWIKT